MCEADTAAVPSVLTRRHLLVTAAGAAAVLPPWRPAEALPYSPAPGTDALAINPRRAWASGIPDAGGLPREAADDVKILLVHHSATPNGYAPGDVAARLRSFHRYHTTTKGWPDVAYNFFVDRFGGIWEGRTGSLDGPVIGDATGGNQGYSQLCCFVGDHSAEPPTPEARTSMVALLAHLAHRYGVDPLATATFTSRGSSRWPAGATVTMPTIDGHRAVSQTTCPGDAAFALVRDVFPGAVRARLGAVARPEPVPAPADSRTTSTTTSSDVSQPRPSTTVTEHVRPRVREGGATAATPPEVPGASSQHAPVSGDAPPGDTPGSLGDASWAPAASGFTAALAVIIAGAVWLRRRRTDPPVDPGEGTAHLPDWREADWSELGAEAEPAPGDDGVVVEP